VPRPRLLILITLAEVGGAQTYVAGLLPALAAELDVTVAAWGPGPLVDACAREGVRFVPLRYVRRALNPWLDFLGLVELVRLMRRERPDIVHANSSKAGILGRFAAVLARVPVRVFTVHGWAFKAYSGSASTLYRVADRAMRPLTTAIVCVSETELAAGLAARTCTVEQTRVIRNAVALAEQRPDPGEGPTQILSVGRLKEPKDFGTLVDALALLERGSFVARVAGDGPDEPLLREQIAGHRIEDAVLLLGERPDVPELLDAAHVFVLASRSEGLPMSVLEAMAHGVPVVASAVGGLPELVRDGETGLLVPPEDPQALADAIARLAGDQALRERLADAAYRRLRKEFDPERWRGEHLELYRSLLAGTRS
jgi:glycosyltransferase involved in cell wall biosynthesis